MKILHVCPLLHAQAGALAVFVDQIAREQCAAGHEVVVVTTYEKQRATGVDEAPYEVRMVPAESVGRLTVTAETRKLLAACIQEADVVHLHGLWLGWNGTVRACCGMAGVPYFLMPHDQLDPGVMGLHSIRKRTYLILIESRNLSEAAGIVFASEHELILATQSWPSMKKASTHVITPGARTPDPEDWPALRAQFALSRGLRADEPLLLFLGRIHPYEGLNLLIDALTALTDRPWRLVVAGEGDPEDLQELRRRVAEANLEDRVVFLGVVTGNRKWGAFSRADVVVLPSFQERYGLVVPEAMAMGVPIVVSDRVSSAEQVEAAGAGVVFAMNHGLRELVIGLRKLLDLSAREREAMGQRGRAHAAEHFGWADCARELEQLYEEAITIGVDP